jgi:hypothetical protein
MILKPLYLLPKMKSIKKIRLFVRTNVINPPNLTSNSFQLRGDFVESNVGFNEKLSYAIANRISNNTFQLNANKDVFS